MSAQSAAQHFAAAAGAFAASIALRDGADGSLEGMEHVAIAAVALALFVPLVSSFVERGVRQRESAEVAG
jgi:hypothetical protein